MADRLIQPESLRLRQLGPVLVFPAVTLLLVAATGLGLSATTPIILAVLVAGVVCLGLPHGSLDTRLAAKLFADNPRFNLFGFQVGYVLLAAACAVGWIASPNIALTTFLVISALHFGTDWQQRGSVWGRAAYGACVVTFPSLHHADNVRQIYLALGATAADTLVAASAVLAWGAIALALLSVLPQIQRRWQDALELGVIVVGGLLLPPLVFFVLYFCLLHSPRHLLDTSREVGLATLRATLVAVIPTLVATLALAAVLWWLLPKNQLNDRVLQTVFIGLAALTVPHMLLTSAKRPGHARSLADSQHAVS